MEKGLVSVIVPCYNAEKYVGRFLDSILSQTYKKIQLIVIDDGSTDNTVDILKQYKKIVEKENIEYMIIQQLENQGQAAAVNEGLKFVKGEYLTGADSDDEYTKDCIEKKVKFFENNPSYDFLRNECVIKNEESKKVESYLRIKGKKREKNIFEDLILGNHIWFAQGAHMYRTEAFFDRNKGNEIDVSREGQNYQLLLPMAYKNKCGYIDEVLYIIYNRANSHSHTKRTFEQEVSREKEIMQLILRTMKRIEVTDEDYIKYEEILEEKLKRNLISLAYRYQNDKMR